MSISAKAVHERGVALRREGKLGEAIAAFMSAVDADPSQPWFYIDLASTMHAAARTSEAIEVLQMASQLHPRSPDLLSLRGSYLGSLQRFDEAIVCHERAIALSPDYADLWNNFALTRQAQGELQLALVASDRALTLKPSAVEFLYNRGNIVMALGHYHQAEEMFVAALSRDPAHFGALNNLSFVQREQGLFVEAIAGYQKLLTLAPESADAHWHLAMALLHVGNFEEGWKHFEWRRKLAKKGAQYFDAPQWDGTALNGQTLLVHAEQGLGDTVQFIRYLKLVCGGRVVFQTQPALKALLVTQDLGVDKLVAVGETLPRFDVQIPLMSLPRLLHPILDAQPPVPYLRAATEFSLPKEARRKIGISWQGSPDYAADALRSIPLKEFAPLIARRDSCLYSLQKNHGIEQLAVLEKGLEIVDLGSQLDKTGAFIDTASVLTQLDLFICSDSALAHLAGALGVNTWLLLPLVPDWRWGTSGTRCAFYPTMRLFRQKQSRDWAGVIAEVCAALNVT